MPRVRFLPLRDLLERKRTFLLGGSDFPRDPTTLLPHRQKPAIGRRRDAVSRLLQNLWPSQFQVGRPPITSGHIGGKMGRLTSLDVPRQRPVVLRRVPALILAGGLARSYSMEVLLREEEGAERHRVEAGMRWHLSRCLLAMTPSRDFLCDRGESQLSRALVVLGGRNGKCWCDYCSVLGV